MAERKMSGKKLIHFYITVKNGNVCFVYVQLFSKRAAGFESIGGCKGGSVCSSLSIRHWLPKRNSKTRTSLWHCTITVVLSFCHAPEWC